MSSELRSQKSTGNGREGCHPRNFFIEILHPLTSPERKNKMHPHKKDKVSTFKIIILIFLNNYNKKYPDQFRGINTKRFSNIFMNI